MAWTLIPSSFKRFLIHTACQLQLDKAIYLALVEDNATVFYAWDCQEDIALTIWKKYPVWDCLAILSEAQSESVNAITPLLDFPLNIMLIFLVLLRYQRICLDFSICSYKGLALNCAIFMTAKEMSGQVPNIMYSSDPIIDWYSCQNCEVAVPLFASSSYLIERGVHAELDFCKLKCLTILSR